MRPQPVILDTTLRDGSYVVDFQFTPEFTEFLSRALDRLGVKFIEVGHGVGINASNIVAPALVDDVAYVEAARRGTKSAEVVMFCIPGIAELGHLDACMSAGLQVARIGAPPERFREMEPFLALTRKRKGRAMANIMKSYCATAREMGKIGKACQEMGAEAFFIVDSAGTMQPEDVTEYVQAIKAESDITIGFHGHNNLGLVMANCIAAIDAGCTIVDSTLLGMGRASGNPRTENLVALIQRRYGSGHEIDAHLMMELADVAVAPILEATKPDGAIVTALGLGGVHSSYLNKIIAAAAKAGRQPHSTITALGAINKSDLLEAELARALSAAHSDSSLKTLMAIDKDIAIYPGGPVVKC